VRRDLALEASHKIVFQKKGARKKTQFMERLKNWGSPKKETLIFCMQETPLLGASQKLELKKIKEL